ncbi:MAG: hypothetical protein EP338_02115 [Bacteroidetes bacterium]|nr:MAG: hypothetical protein EP338_02115 [Bacteroidota bacterium]
MKIVAICLFLYCLLGSSTLKAQHSPDIFQLRKEGKMKEILEALATPNTPTFNYWSQNRDQRYGVIGFLDTMINRTLSIQGDLFRKRNIQKRLLSREDSLATSISSNQAYYQRIFEGKDSLLRLEKAFHDSLYQIPIEQYLNRNFSTLDYFLMLLRFEKDAETIHLNLSSMHSFYTLQLLYDHYLELIQEKNLLIPETMQRRNLQLIAKRMAEVEHDRFMMYQSYSSPSKKVKAIDFFTDNDFFALIPGMNQDREYTGGGAISINTDYLKWRWGKASWLLKSKRKNGRLHVLTYQSVKLGMHFFTPYIRYRSNYQLADSLYQHDRPFGSFIYLERSKYRLWPKGLVRNQGDFQVGQIGSNAGRDIQAMLHKDVILSSQKVYGWETQVAHGGRWTFQLNQRFDFLLFSNTNHYSSIFRPNTPIYRDCHQTFVSSPVGKIKAINKRYSGFNMYQSIKVQAGGYYTALGTGLYFSGLDFTDQSGGQLIRVKYDNLMEYGFNWTLGFNYHYVVHSTLLEGFGFWNTSGDDPYDDEFESLHALTSDRINRHILSAELKLQLRFRKITAYYVLNLSSKSYQSPQVNYQSLTNLVNPEDQEFYLNQVIPELEAFDKRHFYAYGRIGVSWLLE